MLRHCAVLSFALALSACTAGDSGRIKDAATAPLNDLNLVHAEIPPVLAAAQKQPYGLQEGATCESLAAEVRELDAVLGADVDAAVTEGDPSLMERGGKEAKEAAVGALRSTTESLIPFRGWVRKLSGAERNSKQVAAAINAGNVRRGFIKGVALTRQCGQEIAGQ